MVGARAIASTSRAASSSVVGWLWSHSTKISPASSMAFRERSTPSFSTGSSVFRRPAVSMSRRGTPPSSHRSSTVSRVVPGMSVTMARSQPSIALSREDLPALGRPTIAQGTPSRSSFPRPQEASKAFSSPSWPARAPSSCSTRKGSMSSSG